MNTLLVTGHSGFIGNNLLDSISNQYRIFGLSKKKLSYKKRNQNVTQIKQNILNIDEKKIPRKISCIIHMAALTDVKFCEENPLKCFEINVTGTQNMLEIARKQDSKFLYMSTSHVFGIPKKLPIDENHPRNPTSIYSASKLGGEILCESYSKSYGLDVSIIRLFSIYGPKSPPHLVTSKIISQFLTKKNTLYLGNLSPKRDFVYVNDAIKAIELVLKKIKGFNSYNVGSGKAYSIQEICNHLKKIANKKVTIKTTKSLKRKNDIDKIVANPTKMKKLGWTPETNFYDGIKLTYDWFKHD